MRGEERAGAHPEALAQKLGETLGGEEEQLDFRTPLAAGRRRRQHADGLRTLYDGDRLTQHWRVATEVERTGDELGVLVGRLLELRDLGFEDISGVCLSSTVPPLVRAYEEFARDYAEAPLLVLGPGTKTGIPIVYDDPPRGGPDRIANAVAARERYGAPCIVVDFGTSTNFDIVSAAGEYVGGVLAPGSRSRWKRSSPAPRGS